METSPSGTNQQHVRTLPADESLKPALRRLLTAYLDEFAALTGTAPRPRDDAGHATYGWFDHYWTDATRTPLAIWVGEELAGFCFLRDADDQWRIAEFYVAPPYRRQRVGAAAVTSIKAFCRARGTHALLEASTLLSNAPALSFWHRQGFRTVSVISDRRINLFRLTP
jgi:predicted acetyltransferase